MRIRLVRALSALAVGGVFSCATAAQAATVQFASTVTFTESVANLTFTSSGLNDTLTVGTPLTIDHFISLAVDTGAWSATNSPITATFTFTIPTPGGATTDSGTITGGQVNGVSANGSLSITWPNQPVEFDFANGTKLDVTLADFSTACGGRVDNNCLAGTAPYFLSGTFLVLNGPTDTGEGNGLATPLPAALPMFIGGAGLIGLLARRRKQGQVV